MNINVSGVNGSIGPDSGPISNQNVAGQGTVDTSAASSSSGDSGLAILMSMNKGDVFTGKIIDITQDQVTLLLNGNAQVKATLSDAFSYNIGDYATFSIKDNDTGTIILKSVNSENLKNLMNDRTIGNAIMSAGLAVNDATVSLVNNLMKQGMPIDSNTLCRYARMMDTVPGATPEDVVFMTKMGIPVTEENVTALHDYYDFNEGLTAKADEMAENFTDALSSVIEKEEGAVTESEISGVAGQKENEQAAQNVNDRAAVLLRNLSEVFSPGQQIPEKMADSMEKTVLSRLADNIRGLIPGQSMEEIMSNPKEAAIKNELIENNATRLADKVADGQLTAKEFLNELSELIKNNNTDIKSMARLFKSPEFKRSVDNLLRQEMFIKPENVSNDSLKRMYAKIINDSSRIAQRFAGDPAMNGFVDTARNAASDVNFLNDAGKFMSFVQIPLKMSGQNAKGDLYVYSNKKGRTSDGGDLRAFLHLDMDNLGPLDVLVRLNGKRVTTDFKVATDEILDYIELHIAQLNEALGRLGYNVSTEVQLSDKKYSFKESVLENEMPPASIKRYNFDVRA